MAQQIQLRNDTTAGWEYANPVLAQAEIGVDTTLGKFKIGDGTSRWNALQFQSASIADFVFAYDSEEGSVMTVTDHDMTIQAVRDNDPVTSDCDINIEAADDVWIRAYGDEIGIYAADEVTIQTNSYRGDGTGSGPLYGSRRDWVFDKNGRITFPDGSMQISAGQSLDPLEPFLTWEEQRGHLQYLNTHFGWDSDGIWFTGAAEGGSSYPIFTNSIIPQNVGVTVSFDVDINSECADMGIAIYNAGTTPVWNYSPDTTRIAAQFDCVNLELSGRTTSATAEGGLPGNGIYTVTFTYNPTASTDKVTVSYTEEGSNEVIASVSLNEALPSGPYRIGFAADQNNPSVRTYMSNLSIVTSDNVIDEYSGLKNGDSTIIGGGSANLVVPTAIKDGSGDDFITFTRTSTGTARIGTPQDDLSLRSARDITLIAGDSGPGNVYIGWGDATISPDATNRVATIGDIPDAVKTYTANNEARYGTYQAHGFTEITTEASTGLGDNVYTLGGASNDTLVNFSVGAAQHNVLNGQNPYIRRITITDESGTVRFLRNPTYIGTTEGGYEWRFGCDLTLDLLDATTYSMTIEHGGAPIVWWNADNENPTNEDFSNGNFRGAKIEYHAYVSDGGTVIGTIYIADDSGDDNVTHIETSSGGSDTGTAVFWDRSSNNEKQLSLYRIDGESVTHKIQWTAQMYYATEFYDD